MPELRKKGVKAIVVLIHEGGTPSVQKWTGPDGKAYDANATYDYTCGKGGSLTADSAILPIAAGLDPQIDMVISGPHPPALRLQRARPQRASRGWSPRRRRSAGSSPRPT